MSIGNLVFYVEKGKFMTSRQKQKKGCLSVPVLDVGKNNVDNVDNLVYNWFLRKKRSFSVWTKKEYLVERECG